MDNNEVVLVIGGQEFSCKKDELCRESSYFEAMFRNNFIEQKKRKIEIFDLDVNVFKHILEYTQSSILKDDCDQLKILQASCFLQMAKLTAIVENKIIDTLTEENCLKIWRLADKSGVVNLKTKAFCKALLYFDEIKESDTFIELSFEELQSYLGNCSLLVKDEIDVFECIMQWWYEHKVTREEETPSLVKLLNTIDYGSIDKTQLDIMLEYSEVKKNKFASEALFEIRGKKITGSALSLKGRHTAMSVGLIKTNKKVHAKNKKDNETVVQDDSIIYFNNKTGKMELYTDISPGRGLHLDGYQIVSYKEKLILLGGEYTLGSGNWNWNCWEYDSLKEKWELLTVLPSSRRHFKTVVTLDSLYVLGGTGKFRIVQNNILHYNLKSNKWLENIDLPNSFGHLTFFCEYDNRLLLLPGNLNCSCYMLNAHTASWDRLAIENPREANPPTLNYSAVFSYKHSVYVYGENLVQYKLYSNHFRIENSVENKSFEKCDDTSVIAINEDLYILSKHLLPTERYSLKKMSLKTGDVQVLHELCENEIYFNMFIGCSALFIPRLVDENDCLPFNKTVNEIT